MSAFHGRSGVCIFMQVSNQLFRVGPWNSMPSVTLLLQEGTERPAHFLAMKMILGTACGWTGDVRPLLSERRKLKGDAKEAENHQG